MSTLPPNPPPPPKFQSPLSPGPRTQEEWEQFYRWLFNQWRTLNTISGEVVGSAVTLSQQNIPPQQPISPPPFALAGHQSSSNVLPQHPPEPRAIPSPLPDVVALAKVFGSEIPPPTPVATPAFSLQSHVPIPSQSNPFPAELGFSQRAPGIIPPAAASSSAAGIVKPDGTIITVSASGAITVPKASSSTFGVVEVDNTTITASSGVITAATATSSALGIVKPDGTIITVSAGAITVPKASSSVFGVVEVDGTTITASGGVISAVGGGTGYTDVLTESKPLGTAANAFGKKVSVANNATETLLNYSTSAPAVPGYVGFLWLGIGASDDVSILTITTDGNTVFNDRAVLFFAAEYQNTQASFISRFVGASNNDSNNVGLLSYIPIPFAGSVSIAFTNKTGGTINIWWTINYVTGVPNTWPNTRKLRCASGTIAAAIPYSANVLLNATGLNPGRLLGIGFSIDSYPGSASPATAPMEGAFKIFVDGNASPSIESSGTEDYIGMSNYFQGFPVTSGNTGVNSTSSVAAYSGLTVKSTVTWNAYRFHIMDPITFNNALKMTWNAGDSTAVAWTGTVRFAYCIWYYTE